MKSTVIALAAAASLAAGAAQALTVTAFNGDTQGSMSLSSSGPTTSGTAVSETLTFDWTSNPSGVAGYFEFTLATTGKLTFDSFVIDAATGGSPVSGLILYRGTDSSVASADYLADSTTNCSGSTVARIAGSNGSCDLFSERAPGSPDELFGPTELTAGDYTIGVYDSGDPTDATAEFTVTDLTAVPLPASALLLGGLFGGLAWRARRKAT